MSACPASSMSACNPLWPPSASSSDMVGTQRTFATRTPSVVLVAPCTFTHPHLPALCMHARPCACRNFDLDIPAGQTVALVGESGSGKVCAPAAPVRLCAAPGCHGQVASEETAGGGGDGQGCKGEARKAGARRSVPRCSCALVQRGCMPCGALGWLPYLPFSTLSWLP